MASKGLVSGRDGFTLIELLVVIAIILILAALAVPVLARAAAHARDVKGVSNVRQCSQGLIQYSGTNDGSFPCAYNYEDGWDNWVKYTWRERILPFVAGAMGDTPVDERRIPEGQSIYKCTARSQWPAENQAQSVYGMNSYLGMWSTNAMRNPNTTTGQPKHTHMDTIDNTSETILIAENVDGDWVTVPNSGTKTAPTNASSFSRTGNTGYFHPYHRNNRAPFGFADARVQLIEREIAHERKLHLWKVAKKTDPPT